MSQEYKVTWVGETIRPYQTNAGHDLVAYELEVEGYDGRVEWSRKPDSDRPQVGETTPLADIKNGPNGPKLQVNWDAVKAQKGGGGSSDYRPRSSGQSGKSPTQEASIHRQVALKILAPTINEKGLTDRVKAVAQEIESFINEAGAPKPDPIEQVKEAFGATPVENTEVPAVAAPRDGDNLPF